MTSRLVELETMVMHLQRDVDVLQEVIREQQQELKKFAGLLGRLDDRIQRLDTPGEFDAWSERPPHY